MLNLFTKRNKVKVETNQDNSTLINEYKNIISNLRIGKQDSTTKAEIKNLERLIKKLEGK